MFLTLSLRDFITEMITLLLAGKDIVPRTINDVKLINGGKILENNRTIAESRIPVGELPGGVITMHVVVRPPVFDKNSGTLFMLELYFIFFIFFFSQEL